MTDSSFLLCEPTVYAVRQHYEIVYITAEPGAAWVLIAGKRYTDQMCGVVRSGSCTHHVRVPAGELDLAGRYTVCLARIPERHSYFPKTERLFTAEFSFRPLPAEDIRVYMLADTHSELQAPIAAAGYFGSCPDLLILGGDNGNTASNPESVMTMARLAAAVTHGEAPVIYMRGNHDTRGAFAEWLPDYVGTDCGKTYFPFRLGRLWGVVLDAGEDKTDDHAEYGDIADYTAFRDAQTDMLHSLTREAAQTCTPEAEVRLALCHIPFGVIETPFSDVYDRWTAELNRLGVDLMLSGHCHRLDFVEPGSTSYGRVMPDYPVVIGSRVNRKIPESYAGTALIIGSDRMTVRFTDVAHRILQEHTVPLRR